MDIEFRECPTEERDFQLEVRKSGALLGRVRRDASGFFQYFRGHPNELMFEFRPEPTAVKCTRVVATRLLAVAARFCPEVVPNSRRDRPGEAIGRVTSSSLPIRGIT